MNDFKTAAVLGAGVIGASWTALFAAAGINVRVFDVSSSAEDDVLAYVENAWPTLMQLGLAVTGRKGSISFHSTASSGNQTPSSNNSSTTGRPVLPPNEPKH